MLPPLSLPSPSGALPQKSFDSKNTTLRALTIKQLAAASAARSDDTLIVDGREVSNVRRRALRREGRCCRRHRRRGDVLQLHPTSSHPPCTLQVTIVGKVLSANESGLTYGLEVDDGTGTATVKIWMSEDGASAARLPAACRCCPAACLCCSCFPAGLPAASMGAQLSADRLAPLLRPLTLLPAPPTQRADSELDRQRRAEWRPGMYVRVHGHINSFGRTQEVVAFNIRPITDSNEVRRGAARAGAGQGRRPCLCNRVEPDRFD